MFVLIEFFSSDEKSRSCSSQSFWLVKNKVDCQLFQLNYDSIKVCINLSTLILSRMDMRIDWNLTPSTPSCVWFAAHFRNNQTAIFLFPRIHPQDRKGFLFVPKIAERIKLWPFFIKSFLLDLSKWIISPPCTRPKGGVETAKGNCWMSFDLLPKWSAMNERQHFQCPQYRCTMCFAHRPRINSHPTRANLVDRSNARTVCSRCWLKSSFFYMSRAKLPLNLPSHFPFACSRMQILD